MNMYTRQGRSQSLHPAVRCAVLGVMLAATFDATAFSDPPISPAAAPKPATATAQSATRRQVTLPKNFFSLPDTATVDMGGKPVTVGELKRKFAAAFEAKRKPPVTKLAAKRSPAQGVVATPPNPLAASRWQTAPTTVNSAAAPPAVSRPPAVGAAPNWGSAASGPAPSNSSAFLSPARGISVSSNAAAASSSLGALSTPFSATSPPSSSLQPRAVPQNLVPATQAAMQDAACAHTPQIRAVGTLNSNAAFQIAGGCFGTQQGQILVVGNLPNGRVQVPVLSWTDNAISGQMPAISGSTDGIVSVTVVTADGKRSPDSSANFVAARERVDVSSKWLANNHYLFQEIASDVTVTEYEDFQTPIDNSSQFSIAVNSNCALDNMNVVMRAGTFLGQKGFEDGPLYSATTTVTTAEYCVITGSEQTGIYGYGDITWNSAPCQVEYDLQAFAYCPVGVAP